MKIDTAICCARRTRWPGLAYRSSIDMKSLRAPAGILPRAASFVTTGIGSHYDDVGYDPMYTVNQCTDQIVKNVKSGSWRRGGRVCFKITDMRSANRRATTSMPPPRPDTDNELCYVKDRHPAVPEQKQAGIPRRSRSIRLHSQASCCAKPVAYRRERIYSIICLVIDASSALGGLECVGTGRPTAWRKRSNRGAPLATGGAPFLATNEVPHPLAAVSYSAERAGMAMEFGVLDHLDISSTIPLQDHYENRLKFIEALDSAGFYGFHVTEHHATPLGGAASPSVFLAAAAQRTKTIRLGTLVYSLPTHHPLRLIEEICMLDQLSNGRIDIGFGRGSVPFELSYFGVNPEHARSIYDEALHIVLQGLRTRKLNYQGKYFQFTDLPLKLEPRQKPNPPLWYGVHSVESAERAARSGFNIVCNQPSKNSAEFIKAYRETWRQTQGNGAEPKIGLQRAVHVAPSDAEAFATAHRAYAAFLESFRFVTKRHGAENRLSGRENDFAELMDIGRGVAGSPRMVADYLEHDLRSAGANYCIMYLAFGDLTFGETMQSVRLFADAVIPKLKGVAGAGATAIAAV
ncbi:MAG: LLM class flavin-dependent oxidoreductase [Rhizobiales bacterium]|nr:LLM class flavin-dependent oxidoreductase [Hyphomicrobiales bacterium]